MKPRTKLFIFCLIVGYTGLLSFNAIWQTYKLDNNNKVIQIAKDTTKVKQADKVHSIVNGVTFYQGSKGGVYCWKVSRTGKKYKYYVPKVK